MLDINQMLSNDNEYLKFATESVGKCLLQASHVDEPFKNWDVTSLFDFAEDLLRLKCVIETIGSEKREAATKGIK